MKKLKIGIIAAFALFLCMFATLIIAFIIPKLSVFWSEIVVPNKEIFTGVMFALTMLWLSMRKWPLWIKIVLGATALSCAGKLSGTSLADLSSETAYRIIISLFLIISFVVMLWKKSRKNFRGEKEEKEPRKSVVEIAKEKWDAAVIKIAGNESDGAKKIALYTLGAIVIGLVLLPFAIRILDPVWNLLILPARDCILLAIVTGGFIFLSIRYKSIILKVVAFGIIIAGLSMIYGTDVPGIMKDSWYQLFSAVAIAAIVGTFAFQGDQNDVKNIDTRNYIAVPLAAVLMLLSPLLGLANNSGFEAGLIPLLGLFAILLGLMSFPLFNYWHHFWRFMTIIMLAAFIAVASVSIFENNHKTEIVKIRHQTEQVK